MFSSLSALDEGIPNAKPTLFHYWFDSDYFWTEVLYLNNFYETQNKKKEQKAEVKWWKQSEIRRFC